MELISMMLMWKLVIIILKGVICIQVLITQGKHIIISQTTEISDYQVFLRFIIIFHLVAIMLV